MNGKYPVLSYGIKQDDLGEWRVTLEQTSPTTWALRFGSSCFLPGIHNLLIQARPEFCEGADLAPLEFQAGKGELCWVASPLPCCPLLVKLGELPSDLAAGETSPSAARSRVLTLLPGPGAAAATPLGPASLACARPPSPLHPPPVW